ncbi:hypothetical protein LMH87_010163 [Akanthomyces muscarius]|uniref:Uncharacterized protein n=1 Tax=Akanthomyces muscarius TaxID=2231603 RepID=A0A9W8UMN2_AKAMU|nr:hypothetical protein LMH87_010163 [Akanthomyces muscarius]KAJ4153685.1 hypothetical protein LMH87_010163 [Akanthomyces muscarius]
MVTRNEGQDNSANEERFQFVSVPAPDQRRDSKCRRQARSHAVKQGLMRKRKSQQDSQQNFHTMRCVSTDTDAFDPFESLAVDSSRLRVLLDDYRGRQAPEPVFSVSKPLAFQSFQAVFREGLVDPTLVNAVMLALVSAVTGSKMDKERLGYQQHAIVGIRKRMDRVEEATSETTIGAILLLAGIEARMGRRGQVQLHMGAVQQLLTICKERGIYLTAGIKRAIFWQDLNASILAGSPRLFSHTTFAELQWTRDTFSPSFYRAPPGFAKRRGVLGDEFIEILEDLHALQCIRNIPGAKRGDPLMMAYINNHTASIQSRLGLLRAEGVVARSCRFAAYICSVMLCCTVWCGLFIPSHISEQLFRELNRTRDEEIWEEDLDLMLWLACIGGAFAPEGGVGDGYVKLLAEMTERIFVISPRSWQGVEYVLEQFIWSESAFLVPVQTLWERVGHT